MSLSTALASDPEVGSGALTIAPDDFDSQALGLRICRIVSLSAREPEEYHSLLSGLKARLRAQAWQQVLRRTELGHFAEIWALERAGFELMDVGVTFARTLPGEVQPPVADELVIRPSTDRDIEQIAEAMVRAPWGSRYESDPAYDPARVAELRRRWLWNSHRGRADVVFVGVLDGEPAGYVTCRLDRETGDGEIELVGTLPRFRGRRVANRVLAHAVGWFSDRARLVSVRTQATNIAAAKLYQTSGFTLASSDATFRLTID